MTDVLDGHVELTVTSLEGTPVAAEVTIDMEDDSFTVTEHTLVKVLEFFVYTPHIKT